jgi:hypothetical protein
MATLRTIRTTEKRQKLLDAIADGLTIGEAAKIAGVGRRSVFEWKNDDAEFRRDYELAYESGTDVLESVARERAFAGSDALLIFLLKQRDPHRFNQRMLLVAGDPNNPIGVEHTVAADEVVHFFLPSNGRDGPEEVIGAPFTIEGRVADADSGDADEDAA